MSIVFLLLSEFENIITVLCVYMICASRSLPVWASAVPETANVNSRQTADGASACPRPKIRPSGRSLLISSELSLVSADQRRPSVRLSDSLPFQIQTARLTAQLCRHRHRFPLGANSKGIYFHWMGKILPLLSASLFLSHFHP